VKKSGRKLKRSEPKNQDHPEEKPDVKKIMKNSLPCKNSILYVGVGFLIFIF